jgi:hypothetical protein
VMDGSILMSRIFMSYSDTALSIELQ